MKKTVVINVVGLSRRLIGPETPVLQSLLENGDHTVIRPTLPAVTCTAQATYLTGKPPADHGIVGNGWFFKEECEVKFWRQSNKLVQSPKIWELLREEDPNFSCANLFWWYNMYSTVDYSVTPRPNYLADGRKIPDVYSYPPELRDELQNKLGQFPLFNFWGPRTSIKSSKWIADAAIHTDKKYNPTLGLIYLPHLDYNLQRYGSESPKIAQDLREIDELVGQLLDYYKPLDTEILLLSEYGITDVDRPVHINRVLRHQNWLAIREERGLELLDAGASKVFAVADHQLAHVYVREPDLIDEVMEVLKQQPGIQDVYRKADLPALNHDRSGDLIAIADSRSWFTYYYWESDAKAPDFARTVDIHKKPGYDPVEMLTNPKDPFVGLKVVWKLLRKKLGFRTLMDVIPLQAELIKGSHGRLPEDQQDFPIFISERKGVFDSGEIDATEVFRIIYNQITTK